MGEPAPDAPMLPTPLLIKNIVLFGDYLLTHAHTDHVT